MENGPFIDGLPSYKMVDLSMAMLNNQMVYDYICIYKKNTAHLAPNLSNHPRSLMVISTFRPLEAPRRWCLSWCWIFSHFRHQITHFWVKMGDVQNPNW